MRDQKTEEKIKRRIFLGTAYHIERCDVNESFSEVIEEDEIRV